MSILKSRRIPIIILVICIIFSCISSILLVSADTSFSDTNAIWGNTNDTIEANDTVYPYDSDEGYSTDVEEYHGGATIKISRTLNREINSVGLDITYGIRKPLVIYYGELPYDATHDSNGETLSGWSGYKFTEVPITNENYWGKISGLSGVYKSGKFASKEAAENINNDSIKSLRLYALQNSPSGMFGGLWFTMKNILYNIMGIIAWISTQFVRLIVQGKNIEAGFIFEALHLEDLTELVDELVISKDGHPSLFYVFCLCALILTIISYIYSYVTAGKKTTDFWRIFASMLIGLIIVGMCNGASGRLQLGDTLANAADTIMYAIVQDSGASGGGGAFEVDIKNEKNKSKCVQAQELSVLYKPYIDIQLCAQFHITDVESLNFDNLGDSGGSIAKTTLNGIKNADMEKDFNNNLGYYFWFANSNAKEKISRNVSLPETSANASEDHLTSMITYLQKQHNAGGHNYVIEELVKSLAYPSTGLGIILMIGFTIVMVLLGIVLFKYGINVVIGKIEIFISLVGLAIAGPLILTGKKKLQDTGKSIVGMLLISFIEITVWGILFDIILYTTAIILSADIAHIVIAIAFLLLFLKFNPYVEQTIKKFLANTTRSISPEFYQNKNALKNKMGRLTRSAANWADNREKVIGYDDNGNEIKARGKGDLLSRITNAAANEFEDANNRKSIFKLNSEATKASRETNSKKSDLDKNNAAKEVEKTEKKINDGVSKTSADIYTEAKKGLEDELGLTGEVTADASGKGITISDVSKIDYAKLQANSEEQRLAKEINSLLQEEDVLKNDYKYISLIKKKNSGKELTEEEAQYLKDQSDKIHSLKTSRQKLEVQLKNRLIELYTIREASKKLKCSEEDLKDKLVEDGDLSKVISDQVTSSTLKDTNLGIAYAKALKEQIEANENEAMHSKKINGVKKPNRTVLETQAIAAMKLAQLTDGEDVEMNLDKEDARIQAMVEVLERSYEQAGDTIARTVSDTEIVKDFTDNTVIDGMSRKEINRAYLTSLPGSKKRQELKGKLEALRDASKDAKAISGNDRKAINSLAKVESEKVIGSVSASDKLAAMLAYRHEIDFTSSKAIEDKLVQEQILIRESIADVSETSEEIKASILGRSKDTQEGLSKKIKSNEQLIKDTTSSVSLEKESSPIPSKEEEQLKSIQQESKYTQLPYSPEQQKAAESLEDAEVIQGLIDIESEKTSELLKQAKIKSDLIEAEQKKQEALSNIEEASKREAETEQLMKTATLTYNRSVSFVNSSTNTGEIPKEITESLEQSLREKSIAESNYELAKKQRLEAQQTYQAADLAYNNLINQRNISEQRISTINSRMLALQAEQQKRSLAVNAESHESAINDVVGAAKPTVSNSNNNISLQKDSSGASQAQSMNQPQVQSQPQVQPQVQQHSQEQKQVHNQNQTQSQNIQQQKSQIQDQSQIIQEQIKQINTPKPSGSVVPPSTSTVVGVPTHSQGQINMPAVNQQNNSYSQVPVQSGNVQSSGRQVQPQANNVNNSGISNGVNQSFSSQHQPVVVPVPASMPATNSTTINTNQSTISESEAVQRTIEQVQNNTRTVNSNQQSSINIQKSNTQSSSVSTPTVNSQSINVQKSTVQIGVPQQSMQTAPTQSASVQRSVVQPKASQPVVQPVMSQPVVQPKVSQPVVQNTPAPSVVIQKPAMPTQAPQSTISQQSRVVQEPKQNRVPNQSSTAKEGSKVLRLANSIKTGATNAATTVKTGATNAVNTAIDSHNERVSNIATDIASVNAPKFNLRASRAIDRSVESSARQELYSEQRYDAQIASKVLQDQAEDSLKAAQASKEASKAFKDSEGVKKSTAQEILAKRVKGQADIAKKQAKRASKREQKAIKDASKAEAKVESLVTADTIQGVIDRSSVIADAKDAIARKVVNVASIGQDAKDDALDRIDRRTSATEELINMTQSQVNNYSVNSDGVDPAQQVKDTLKSTYRSKK